MDREFRSWGEVRSKEWGASFARNDTDRATECYDMLAWSEVYSLK